MDATAFMPIAVAAAILFALSQITGAITEARGLLNQRIWIEAANLGDVYRERAACRPDDPVASDVCSLLARRGSGEEQYPFTLSQWCAALESIVICC